MATKWEINSGLDLNMPKFQDNMEEKQLVAELIKYEDDFRFFQEKREELRKAHKNNYVAILDNKLVGVAPSIEELREKLKKEDIEITETFVEFLPEKETFMVF